jgi:hypothetical protein
VQPDRKAGVWDLFLLTAVALAGLLFAGPAHAILPPPSFGTGPPPAPPPAPPPVIFVESPPPLLPEVGAAPGPIYSLGGGTRTDIGAHYRYASPPQPPVVTAPEPGSLALLSIFTFALLVYSSVCRRRAATPPGSRAGR